MCEDWHYFGQHFSDNHDEQTVTSTEERNVTEVENDDNKKMKKKKIVTGALVMDVERENGSRDMIEKPPWLCMKLPVLFPQISATQKSQWN